jgi:hypothetical protein
MSGLIDRLRDWVSPSDGRAVAGQSTPVAPVPEITNTEAANRREREPTPAERQLAEAVGQKLLHGWLQNRHQTLMPLSVNLARLPAEDRAALARFAALAASAGNREDVAGRLSAWLAAAGADAGTLAAYEAARLSPPALAPSLAEVTAPAQASIAYVLALVAAREGESGDAGHAFADYVARRLALPSAALRSAQRRYGR